MTRPSDEQLQALLDKEAIRENIWAYGRAIDRHDPELLRSLYHPDAIDNHGRFVGTVDDFADYAMGRMEAEFDCTCHPVGSIFIELDGDVANVESYVMAVHIMKATEERGQLLDMLSFRLVDRFERRDGEWRIAQRTVVKDWRHRTPLLSPVGVDEFKLGAPGVEDPSYALGFVRSLVART
jgi:ketosteroid isomerase-like protein